MQIGSNIHMFKYTCTLRIPRAQSYTPLDFELSHKDFSQKIFMMCLLCTNEFQCLLERLKIIYIYDCCRIAVVRCAAPFHPRSLLISLMQNVMFDISHLHNLHRSNNKRHSHQAQRENNRRPEKGLGSCSFWEWPKVFEEVKN